ncbi:unnamed protein product [Peronospora belbahrii]|uniref:Jacalin-type lectin domain-containing protein n=1 Tax=Peronospora belbahrii TaxID=622444 RepID=A0AAU9KUR9_9STRA|nr:unnamed protein product [Peronospora belbahrii]
MVRVLFHLVAALILIAGSVTVYSDSSCKFAFPNLGGYTHGDKFTDTQDCDSSRDVIGIGIRAGEVIDGCGFYWATKNNTIFSMYHGGNGGKWTYHAIDPTKEIIVSVKIFWGKHNERTAVLGLSFTTSLNNVISGGTLKGKEKLYEAPVGYKMCGIEGTSSARLDSVAPLWMKLDGCGPPESTPPPGDKDKDDGSCEGSADKDDDDSSDTDENKHKFYTREPYGPSPPVGPYGPSPPVGPYGPSPPVGPYGPSPAVGFYAPPTPSPGYFSAGGYNAAARPYSPNLEQFNAYGPTTTAYQSGYVRANPSA